MSKYLYIAGNEFAKLTFEKDYRGDKRKLWNDIKNIDKTADADEAGRIYHEVCSVSDDIEMTLETIDAVELDRPTVEFIQSHMIDYDMDKTNGLVFVED